jgi:hypothetical protein
MPVICSENNQTVRGANAIVNANGCTIYGDGSIVNGNNSIVHAKNTIINGNNARFMTYEAYESAITNGSGCYVDACAPDKPSTQLKKSTSPTGGSNFSGINVALSQSTIRVDGATITNTIGLDGTCTTVIVDGHGKRTTTTSQRGQDTNIVVGSGAGSSIHQSFGVNGVSYRIAYTGELDKL